jgi:acyl-CoA synthetase (AMP-forming)/AMP-acid ligase II
VSESNVYGVGVPGQDGRAGMAAIVLQPGASLDATALYAHAARHLPRYAMPAFLRLVPEMEVTGTLKQRKTALAEDGYDPARVGDPLLVRDDGVATYVPLTPETLAAIGAGRLRL